MRRIFDMDNPVMKALAVAADLIVLNLLTLLCCLPVVTAGAALTALYDRVIHLVRGEDSYLIKPFFRSFAGNFKKGTIFWLLLLLAAVILTFDYLAALAYIPGIRYGVLAIAVLLVALAQYVFALLSRYENTLRATLKNAAILAVGYFPRTAAMTVCAVGLWMLAFRFAQIGAPVLMLFGLSLPCYINALLLRGVFNHLDDPDGDSSADNDTRQDP